MQCCSPMQTWPPHDLTHRWNQCDFQGQASRDARGGGDRHGARRPANSRKREIPQTPRLILLHVFIRIYIPRTVRFRMPSLPSSVTAMSTPAEASAKCELQDALGRFNEKWTEIMDSEAPLKAIAAQLCNLTEKTRKEVVAIQQHVNPPQFCYVKNNTIAARGLATRGQFFVMRHIPAEVLPAEGPDDWVSVPFDDGGLPTIRFYFVCKATHGGPKPCFHMYTSRGSRGLSHKLDTSTREKAWHCKVCGARYEASWGCLVEFQIDGLLYYMKAEVPGTRELDTMAMKPEARKHTDGMTLKELYDVLPSFSPPLATFVESYVGGDEDVFRMTDETFYGKLQILNWTQILKMAHAVHMVL